MNVWCSSLCECFHMDEGDALSHSQLVEWTLGSRIQSHWPCMTLWPISMFSRIFEPGSTVEVALFGML